MNANMLSEILLLVSASVVGDLGGRAYANRCADIAHYARGSR
jgi:hypothetical protein